jgi:MerR family transcriptional regulator, light-induced transcriptional regulator
MNAFTIKDLENLSGIKAHTIRIWEQRYTFLNPQRTDTNIRYYSSDELKTILNIALLNKYGYKISHINRMSPDEMGEKILSLNQAQAHQEKVINDLIHHMIDLEMERFAEVLDGYIATKGIEKTMPQIIFPFMERIGILWLSNHINPAQEHLVTNIVRQKMIVAIDKMQPILQLNKTFLLFLPEGEYHELGLLYMHYLLKSRGAIVWYIGANVPIKDVEYVARLKKPHFLYSHLTSVANNFNFDKFLAQLHSRLPDFKVLVSGHLTQGYKKSIPANVGFKRSLTEVMDYITTI